MKFQLKKVWTDDRIAQHHPAAALLAIHILSQTTAGLLSLNFKAKS